MANLIIKPTTGGSLILQDEGGTAANTIDASGNTTLAGTANNIGTVTAGNIGALGKILHNIVIFTASGTWTKPSGVTAVRVFVTGGGGGGGGHGASNDAGGCGGSGATAILYITSGLGSTETVTIGAAGNGGASGQNDGTAGGTSSFGSHCSATGGGLGKHGNYGSVKGGLGGTATGTGALLLGGSDGGHGSDDSFTVNSYYASFGTGGASYWGGSGRPSSYGNTGYAINAGHGTAYGAGGGGGSENSGAGGNGKIGVVYIEEYK